MHFCLGIVALFTAAGVGYILPLVRRLWRLPQVQVRPHEKDSDALRVGLMGATFLAKASLVWSAGKLRDVRVVAVASRDARRSTSFAEQHGIPVALSGPEAYAEMLKREDVDAVYIVLPTALHLRWASAAIRAGKHVLLEKPGTLNAKEAATLRDLAAGAGVVLMEAAHYQHHPAAQRTRKMIWDHSFGLGWLTDIQARHQQADPKAVLGRLGAWLGRSEAATTPEERAHRRVKNLDRWWYCADELLWMTHATGWQVVAAAEERFALRANLTLSVPFADGVVRSVDATIQMASDQIVPPWDWSVAAQGTMGRLKLKNLGFPFIYHAIEVEAIGGRSNWREQHYGQGESTFELQLASFVDAVRQGSKGDADRMEATMRLVDDILTMAGGGPLPSQEA